MIQPFSPIEVAVKEAIETAYPAAVGKVGGDASYSGEALYVQIALLDGVTDQNGGEWAVDIDVFGQTFADAMGSALTVEAVLLDRRHVTTGMLIDRVVENSAPHQIPWGDDEETVRITATYTFVARRRG